MKTVAPISTAELFPLLDQKLITLLKSLRPNDWKKSTISPNWNVKDIVLHLLDGNLRGISAGRDHHFHSPAVGEDLIAFIDKQNKSWVEAGQRLSNALIIELLEITNNLYYEHIKKLDPYEQAVFSVAWAGEDKSANWFHIAREYTEKYHHQLQIRLPFHLDEELMTYKFYLPFLETVMRSLPGHFREIDAPIASVISIQVSDGFGVWYLMKSTDGWELYSECDIHPVCQIHIQSQVAWRLFTKGLSERESQKYIDIEGNMELGEKILTANAIMG